MQPVSLLQIANGEPDVSTSVAAYAAWVPQWGFPPVHTQLLQELKAWAETVPALRRQPVGASLVIGTMGAAGVWLTRIHGA